MVYSEKNLKSKANEAKKRLMSGYFHKSDSQQIIAVNGYHKQYYHSNGIDYLDEEKMYEIVSDIMRQSGVVINPIGCLMDREKFESLDYADRQRYVLKLSEIYIKLKARYIQENSYV